MIRRVLGAALRYLRKRADLTASRIDPAYAVELMSRAQAQYEALHAASVAPQPTTEVAPPSQPELHNDPLECQVCMGHLVRRSGVHWRPCP